MKEGCFKKIYIEGERKDICIDQNAWNNHHRASLLSQLSKAYDTNIIVLTTIAMIDTLQCKVASSSNLPNYLNVRPSRNPKHHNHTSHKLLHPTFQKVVLLLLITRVFLDVIYVYKASQVLVNSTIDRYSSSGHRLDFQVSTKLRLEQVDKSRFNEQITPSNGVRKQKKAEQRLKMDHWMNQQKSQKQQMAWPRMSPQIQYSSHGVDPHITNILHSANITQIGKDLANVLPTWEDIVGMYGDHPIISGLETCEAYREKVKPEDRMTGPAGMFNTGTNLLRELLTRNCDIKEARLKPEREPKHNGMRGQVPVSKI